VKLHRLLEKGIQIQVYDPVAMDEVRILFGDTITYCRSLEESAQSSSMIILVTEWDEFRNVDFGKLGKKMHHKIMIDGRNIYEGDELREEGFDYTGVGHR